MAILKPMSPLYKAENVAKYLINLSSQVFIDNKEREGITNLKLQKILYFAQAYYLAKLGQPLFSDKIEAWDYGPVVPSVYRGFKHHGRKPIVLKEDASTLAEDDKNNLKKVWSTFGAYSAGRLVEVVHAHAPWKEANASKEKVISQKAIQDYYGPLLNK